MPQSIRTCIHCGKPRRFARRPICNMCHRDPRLRSRYPDEGDDPTGDMTMAELEAEIAANLPTMPPDDGRRKKEYR